MDYRHPPPNRRGSKYSSEEGVARLYAETGEPPGPGVMAYSGFATRKRLFHPNLTGNSLFEVTLLDYDHDGEFLNNHLAAYGTDAEEEDPLVGRYQAGFYLAIGSCQGLVGSESYSVPGWRRGLSHLSSQPLWLYRSLQTPVGPWAIRRRQHGLPDAGRGHC